MRGARYHTEATSDWALGRELGSITARVDAIESDLSKAQTELHWLRRGLILLAISTAGAVGNLKAETVGELAAALLRQVLKL